MGRYEPPNTLCLDRRNPRRSGADNSEPNCTHGACSQPNDCEAIGEPACRAGELKVQSSPSKCREHRVDAICICSRESGGGLSLYEFSEVVQYVPNKTLYASRARCDVHYTLHT